MMKRSRRHLVGLGSFAVRSADKVGVYSSAGVWASIFGTGTDSLIPNTYE